MNEELEQLVSRYKKACERKQNWEPHWQECYAYAFPQRENAGSTYANDDYGAKKNLHLFDGTAPDAVDQLASSLLAELTPPWAKWFGLKAGTELSAVEKEQVAEILDKTSNIMLQNFEHSNFAVEIHQCYLDLIIVGTACLMFEEAPVGESSAYRFYAVPLREIALEESADGKIDTTFRCSHISLDGIRTRFPSAEIPPQYLERFAQDTDYKIKLIEAVCPRKTCGYEYKAFAWDEDLNTSESFVFKEGIFETSRQDVGNVFEWINLVAQLGTDGTLAVNFFEAAKWLGKTLNVPANLIIETKENQIDGAKQQPDLVAE